MCRPSQRERDYSRGRSVRLQGPPLPEHLVGELRSVNDQVQKVNDALNHLSAKFVARGGDEMGEPIGASLEVSTKVPLASGAGPRKR